MALSSLVTVSLRGKLTGTPDLGSAEANVAAEYTKTFANGALAGQADRIWADTGTLAASANTDLDLAGALTDVFGATVTFARVKAIVVAARDANTNNVVVGAAASNPWIGLLGATHTLTVRPGAFIAMACGSADLTAYAVVAGTGDLLRLANSGAGTSVTYDIAILGTAT
jgi:hypothetical protein